MARRWSRGMAWALVVLSLLAAATVLVDRFRQEQANRSVDLVLDYPSFRDFALETGYPLETLLRDLRQAGVSAVSVWEVYIDELESAGLAAVRRGAELQAQQAVTGGSNAFLARLAAAGELKAHLTYVLPVSAEVAERLQRALALRLGNDRVRRLWPQPGEAGGGAIEVVVAEDQLEHIGTGFNREATELAQRTELRPVFRPANAPAVSPELVDEVFQSIDRLAPATVRTVMFAGREVLGYRPDDPQVLAATAAALNRGGYVLDLIEHASQLAYIDQKGQEDLARALNYRVARVYSMGQAEIDKFRPEVTVEKWVRSVGERNLRVLYLRPFRRWQDPGETLVQTNVKYFARLTETLRHQGYRIGPPGTFAPVTVVAWQQVVIGLGAVGAGALWLGLVWPLAPALLLALQLVASAMVAAGITVAPNTGPQLLALAAAIAFPTLGATVLLRRWGGYATAPPSGIPGIPDAPGAPGDSGVPGALPAWAAAPEAGDGRAGARTLIAGLGILGGLSLVGGLLVAAMLGNITFMLEFRYFRGVKVAFVIPLVLSFAAYFVMGRPGRSRQVVRDTLGYLWLASGSVVRYWHVALGLLGAVAAFWYIQRSGNFPVVPVPTLELQLRQWLEDLLVVRPRFKEFVIGYPALALAVLALRRQVRMAVMPLVLVAATAGISVVNSFSHLRTPWLMSLVRVFNGLWLGLVAGLVVYAVGSVVLRWLGRQLQPYLEPAAGDGDLPMGPPMGPPS